MIARLWHGYTTPENADSFEAAIQNEVFPKLRTVRGFLGGKLLRRALFQEVEFVGLTYFDSLESARAATGVELGHIAIPHSGRGLLTRYEERVAIYTVSVNEPAQR